MTTLKSAHYGEVNGNGSEDVQAPCGLAVLSLVVFMEHPIIVGSILL